LASSAATAQRTLAPAGCWSSSAEEDGGLYLFKNSSIGIWVPCPSVTGTVPCLKWLNRWFCDFTCLCLRDLFCEPVGEGSTSYFIRSIKENVFIWACFTIRICGSGIPESGVESGIPEPGVCISNLGPRIRVTESGFRIRRSRIRVLCAWIVCLVFVTLSSPLLFRSQVRILLEVGKRKKNIFAFLVGVGIVVVFAHGLCMGWRFKILDIICFLVCLRVLYSDSIYSIKPG
jgi:hypothetical protein